MNSSVENGSVDLLRLPAYRVTGSYDEGEALIIKAKTREAHIPRCCLLRSVVRNGTKVVRYRDHTLQSRTTWLEIARQRYRCKECGNILYETLPDVDGD